MIVPARDEAASIAATVTALMTQISVHSIHVTVVDDGSTDGTAEIARNAAIQLGCAEALTVMHGRPLAPGWTGKLWALSQGVEHSLREQQPHFLLFTDADIVHGEHSLSELTALANSGPYDLTSFMVKLQCRTPAERLLIPAFVFFFFLLYPPAFIQSSKRQTAGAAGGCVLIRPQALAAIGGLAAIRDEVIDDCALARHVKDSGGRVWLGLTDSRRSLRSYQAFREVESMIARTAFRQLNHSALLLAGTIGGLLLTYVAPLLFLAAGSFTMRALGASAFLLMAVAYLPTVRFYKLSPLWSLTLPLAAVFYAGATVHSAVLFWSHRGGEWKGRFQDLRS